MLKQLRGRAVPSRSILFSLLHSCTAAYPRMQRGAGKPIRSGSEKGSAIDRDGVADRSPKMGIEASATCVMNFDDATRWVVVEPTRACARGVAWRRRSGPRHRIRRGNALLREWKPDLAGAKRRAHSLHERLSAMRIDRHQVMTSGVSRPVRWRRSASSSAVAIRSASAACVSFASSARSGS